MQPIQQFRYTTGKNATDSALIIDAMDLLHSGTVDGFCIASSDSDFTRLAMRIREQGFFAMGIGRDSTPAAFVNACEVFVYTQNLDASNPAQTDQRNRASDDSKWPELIMVGVEATSRDDGWAHLGAVGTHVRKLDSAFDSRTFGYSKLSELIGSRPDLFSIRKAQSGDKPHVLYVKLVGKAIAVA